MSTLSFQNAMRLLARKDHQAVYQLCIAALRRKETDPLAFFFLGIVATDHGENAKALEFFAKAVEHGPRNTRYHAYHARALMTLGRTMEAKAAADNAASSKIDDAFVADMIGTVYSRAGDHAAALPLFRRAVTLNPNWPLFQFNLGASAQFVGDMARAKAAYEAALSLDPTFYRAHFARVSLERQTPETERLDALERLFDGAANTAEARSLLGHAIAKTLEDLDRHPESLDWLHKAKAMQASQSSYRADDMATVFAAAAATAAPRERPARDPDRPIPVFILGLPRTGTTLLDRILSSHTEVESVGELDLFSRLVTSAVGERDPYGQPVFQKARDLDVAALGALYRTQLREMSGPARYAIDKTPLNFFYAGLIHRALPEAKIVGLRRGAIDSCLSNYRQLFALGDPRYDYALSLDDMADYYRRFDRLMSHWRTALPADRFAEFHYEDMVRKQEAETRRLLAFCGLDWDPACLHFQNNTAPTDTASSVQVRQPLHADSIGRWRRYGPRLDALRASLDDLVESEA